MRTENELIFKEESYRIIGACFEVYNEEGNGFLEAVYQECLAIELEDESIPFEEQVKLKQFYKDRELRQTYVPDFLCFGEIIVEIKAVKQLTDEHRTQAINYLKSSRRKLCLLVNCGDYPNLEHERFVNRL